MPTPIVICDDSSFARKQMARALPDGWDVEVGFAANGDEALRLIDETGARILFLDLNMPVMDGYEVLEALQERNIDISTIVVSGDIQPEAHRRVMALGALDFIKKPIDKEGLDDLLRQQGLKTGDSGQTIAASQKVEARDVFQEITNVAMGRAADLLARLLGVFVNLPVPRVNTLEIGELHMALQLADDEDTYSAICQGYIGAGIAGEALLLFNDSSITDIAQLMKYDGEIDEQVRIELLMDIANILIGACLKGIAEQLDISFSQGHPVVLGRHSRIDRLIEAGKSRWRKTLAIEVNYAIEGHNIHCDLLLLFTEDSIGTLHDKIAYMLN